MKKFFSIMIAFVAMFTMSAQTYVAPKFTDNTYVTLRYGVTGLMKPSSLSSFNEVTLFISSSNNFLTSSIFI